MEYICFCFPAMTAQTRSRRNFLGGFLLVFLFVLDLGMAKPVEDNGGKESNEKDAHDSKWWTFLQNPCDPADRIHTGADSASHIDETSGHLKHDHHPGGIQRHYTTLRSTLEHTIRNMSRLIEHYTVSTRVNYNSQIYIMLEIFQFTYI